MDYNLHLFPSAKFVSVVDEAILFFRSTPVHSLPPPESFVGCGVYGLYYIGDFELYSSMGKKNRKNLEMPIYIGKAVPPGWRTARVKPTGTPDLYRRLSEHARSITQSDNLKLDGFRCRFMVLSGTESDLVVPVEAELIRRYRPLWNSVVDGFGNHDPGSGRYNQAKSEWDVLHPGRVWASRLTGKAPDLATVMSKVQSANEISGLS